MSEKLVHHAKSFLIELLALLGENGAIDGAVTAQRAAMGETADKTAATRNRKKPEPVAEAASIEVAPPAVEALAVSVAPIEVAPPAVEALPNFDDSAFDTGELEDFDALYTEMHNSILSVMRPTATNLPQRLKGKELMISLGFPGDKLPPKGVITIPQVKALIAGFKAL